MELREGIIYSFQVTSSLYAKDPEQPKFLWRALSAGTGRIYWHSRKHWHITAMSWKSVETANNPVMLWEDCENPDLLEPGETYRALNTDSGNMVEFKVEAGGLAHIPSEYCIVECRSKPFQQTETVASSGGICRCDIHQIWNFGHLASCPEGGQK